MHCNSQWYSKYKLYTIFLQRPIMPNKHHMTPWLMLAGIFILLGMIAGTDIFAPVMRFVHSDQGDPWQLALCVLVAVLALRLAYVLLNTICRYYSGLFNERIRQQDTLKEQ